MLPDWIAETISEVSTWRGPVTSLSRLLPTRISSVTVRIQKIGPRRKRFTSILAREDPDRSSGWARPRTTAGREPERFQRTPKC